MPIRMNQSTAERLGQGMNMGGGIELPFHAPVLWVVNGAANQRQANNALFYGGWAGKMTDIQEAQRNWLVEFVPSGFVESEIFPEQGESFPAFLTRSLFVAPIGLRVGWIGPGQTRYAKYEPGARQHVQALVFVGSREKTGATVPWGPAVLSAKGYQAGNITKAFKDWEKHTAAIRKSVAPGIPAWCFYLAIGTFGKDRTAIQVGKNSKSPITPIGAYLPEKIDESTLESLFVGEEVAEEMATYLADAAEWLNAWAKPEPRNNGGHAAGMEGPDFGDDYVPPEPGEDVPF